MVARPISAFNEFHHRNRSSALMPFDRDAKAVHIVEGDVDRSWRWPYLTPAEIEKLIKAVKEGRWGLRDACLIMVADRHGLRAKEACELKWRQVEFGRSAALHVRRAEKGSRPFIRSVATNCAFARNLPQDALAAVLHSLDGDAGGVGQPRVALINNNARSVLTDLI
jgi:integrase